MVFEHNNNFSKKFNRASSGSLSICRFGRRVQYDVVWVTEISAFFSLLFTSSLKERRLEETSKTTLYYYFFFFRRLNPCVVTCEPVFLSMRKTLPHPVQTSSTQPTPKILLALSPPD